MDYKAMLTVFRTMIIFLVGILPAIAAAETKLQKVEGDTFILDLRYGTDDNFLKKNVYQSFGLEQCWVQPDLFAALQKLAPKLREQNLKLVFWDCYRPLAVQEAMWKLVPNARYVANPKSGSNHNRGVAIDVTLADAQGSYLVMPTAFDDFSAKAAPDFRCTTDDAEKCKNRDRLIELMKAVGLTPINSEWWHFQLPRAGKYPIVKTLDAPLP